MNIFIITYKKAEFSKTISTRLIICETTDNKKSLRLKRTKGLFKKIKKKIKEQKVKNKKTIDVYLIGSLSTYGSNNLP